MEAAAWKIIGVATDQMALLGLTGVGAAVGTATEPQGDADPADIRSLGGY